MEKIAYFNTAAELILTVEETKDLYSIRRRREKEKEKEKEKEGKRRSC